MTDYEINKRLAEIAGVSLYAKSDESGLCRIRGKSRQTLLWSPLIDWSQLGPLMERFGVYVGPEYGELEEYEPGSWRERLSHWEAVADEGLCQARMSKDPDLKRAICLAIIAAHKSPSPGG